MIIQVNPNNFNCAKQLVACKVERIAVGYDNLSTRTTCLLNKQQLVSLIKIANKTKIYVLVNRFFFEHEIEELTKKIILLSRLGVHGFIFCDYAIPQILKENKISIPLVYDSPNMVTNFGQFDFFIKNKIGEVMLSPDLDESEIKEIINNKNKMKIQMHFVGLGYMFCSK
jgi:collagenase-like PrtC family protease